MKSYISPKAEKRISKKNGTGLFAKTDIAEGEIIAIKSGHILNWDQTIKVVKEIGDYYTQISDDFFLSPMTKDELPENSICQNHSCDPNSGLIGQITFVTLRDVKAGEELCYDYAMTTNHLYEFKCTCDSKKCRGIVTGEDWQRKDLQKKYGEHFSTFILKKIKASNVPHL